MLDIPLIDLVLGSGCIAPYHNISNFIVFLYRGKMSHGLMEAGSSTLGCWIAVSVCSHGLTGPLHDHHDIGCMSPKFRGDKPWLVVLVCSSHHPPNVTTKGTHGRKQRPRIDHGFCESYHDRRRSLLTTGTRYRPTYTYTVKRTNSRNTINELNPDK